MASSTHRPPWSTEIDSRGVDLSALQIIPSAGSALPIASERCLADRPRVEVCNVDGASETGIVAEGLKIGGGAYGIGHLVEGEVVDVADDASNPCAAGEVG